jgi:HK97 gp10 family phage protein
VPDGFELTITGLDEALAELRALPQVIQQRVMRGAVAKGASVIRAEAVRRAPVYDGPALGADHAPPGTLRKAIYQARIPSQCTPVREVFRVDVRKGKRKSGKGGASVDAYYASWVEYGHFARVPHEMTKTAKAAGRALGVARQVPAHPFMRPAIEAAAPAAIEAMRAYIAQQLPLAGAAMRYLKINGK